MQVYYLELFLPVNDSVLAETLLASLPKGLTLYPKEWNYSSSVFHPEDRWGDTVNVIQPVGTRNHFTRKLNYDVAGPFSSKICQEAHSRLGCIRHEPPVELRWEGRLLLCLYTAWAFCCQPGCCASAPNTSLLPNLGNTHETMKICELTQKNSSSLALTQVIFTVLQTWLPSDSSTDKHLAIPSQWLTHLPTVIGRRGRETDTLETSFKICFSKAVLHCCCMKSSCPCPWLERKMGLHWGVILGVLSAHQALTPLCLSLLNSLTGELLSSRPVSSRTVGATQRNLVLNPSPQTQNQTKSTCYLYEC